MQWITIPRDSIILILSFFFPGLLIFFRIVYILSQRDNNVPLSLGREVYLRTQRTLTPNQCYVNVCPRTTKRTCTGCPVNTTSVTNSAFEINKKKKTKFASTYVPVNLVSKLQPIFNDANRPSVVIKCLQKTL